jgi:hypothetical protein
MELLTERHVDEIAGVLSCYDRILMQGILPGLCYAEAMTAYLKARQVRIFDYSRFAQPLRDALRENAERLAAEQRLVFSSDPREELPPTLQHRAVAAGAGDPSSRMRACDRKRIVRPLAILGHSHVDGLQADQRLQRDGARGTRLPRLLD